MKLQGKSIIVTGSSMGIGEATARRAVAEGARVLIHGIEPADTEEVAKTLGMPFCVGDLAEPRHCEELVSTAVEEFGQLHGLVNNAGVVWRNLIEETDAAFFDSVMAINARAPLLLIRAALSELGRTRGYVVNIGSVNAYSGEPNLLAYSAAKGALMTSRSTRSIRVGSLARVSGSARLMKEWPRIGLITLAGMRCRGDA
jgi:NAD(P)-dependent dehydrogenase (short-subunit alcohol dehydrogenase family)